MKYDFPLKTEKLMSEFLEELIVKARKRRIEIFNNQMQRLSENPYFHQLIKEEVERLGITFKPTQKEKDGDHTRTT